MLKIVTIPNPVLTGGTKKVERFDAGLLKLVKDMDQTLQAQVNPQGVGLAAPQVGNNLALFIIKPTPESKTEEFINPKILEIVTESSSSNPSSAAATDGKQKQKKKKQRLEGCLSIPKIWGPVTRAKKVLLEYQNSAGKKAKKWFSGFKAVIIQHEVDHLKGILFTQRALEQSNQLFEEKDGDLHKVDNI